MHDKNQNSTTPPAPSATPENHVAPTNIPPTITSFSPSNHFRSNIRSRFIPYDSPQATSNHQKAVDYDTLKIRYERAKFSIIIFPVIGAIITIYTAISMKDSWSLQLPGQLPFSLFIFLLIGGFAIATIVAIIRTRILRRYYHVPPEQISASTAAYFRLRRRVNMIVSFIAAPLFLAGAFFSLFIFQDIVMIDAGFFLTFVLLIFGCACLLNGILYVKGRLR